MASEDLFAVWLQLQNDIREILSEKVYDVMIKPLTPLALDENSFTAAVPTAFFKKLFEEKYSSLLEEKLAKIVSRPLKLVLEIQEKPSSGPATTEKTPAISTRSQKPQIAAVKTNINDGDFPATFADSGNLNPIYGFDNFVIGNSNRLAYAAAQQVAERPGQAYNPLFIYGGAGLGKTHLIQAIGNKIRQTYQNMRLFYITSEEFTNEIVNSIGHKTMEAFHNKYRTIDCLIIDDIQFLEGKEQTQEEFFNTFNTLSEAGKQIVISSDRLPSEIKTLADRLSTRFQKGLLADIQPPDLETRMAILRQFAAADGIDLPKDIVALLATNITNNIRLLQGVYTQLKARTSLMNMPMNLETAQESLAAIGIQKHQHQVNFTDIIAAVTSHFQIKADNLFNKTRTRDITYPRQIAMYLCREYADMSFPKIGEAFGGRDHTTVMHAFEKINQNKETDLQISLDLKYLKETLQQK